MFYTNPNPKALQLLHFSYSFLEHLWWLGYRRGLAGMTLGEPSNTCYLCRKFHQRGPRNRQILTAIAPLRDTDNSGVSLKFKLKLSLIEGNWKVCNTLLLFFQPWHVIASQVKLLTFLSTYEMMQEGDLPFFACSAYCNKGHPFLKSMPTSRRVGAFSPSIQAAYVVDLPSRKLYCTCLITCLKKKILIYFFSLCNHVLMLTHRFAFCT